jgi:hypothetical protein
MTGSSAADASAVLRPTSFRALCRTVGAEYRGLITVLVDHNIEEQAILAPISNTDPSTRR